MTKLLALILIGSVLFLGYVIIDIIKGSKKIENSSNYSPTSVQEIPQEPSEQALKVASLIFVYSDEKQQKELIKTWSDDSGDLRVAIRNLALSFDDDPERLALIEAALERVINQERKTTVRPFVNCSSNVVGSHIYTNCY